MFSTNDKAENTKNLIASKAKEIFSQKGYFQSSMEDIRAHAGMSKGSIYYHFKSKENLFIYILEIYVQEWIGSWKEKSSNLNSAKDKLYALAEHFTMDLESPLTRAATEFAGSEYANPQIKIKLDELNGSYIPVVQNIIVEGIENDEFKTLDIQEITIITYGFLAGIGAVCQIVDYSEVSKIHKMAIEIFLVGLEK